jgi:hypothetical protein
MSDNDDPGRPSGKYLLSDEIVLPSLPKELEYLNEPGIHYGRKYEFDDDVQWFVENADESDLEVLAGLAERVRFSGDYQRFLDWSYEVDEALDRLVDERYPHVVTVASSDRPGLLRLINETAEPPEVAERRRERRLRGLVEARDTSEIAKQRREMRSSLLSAANEKVHHMDIYFLFGLMDACDMKFE